MKRRMALRALASAGAGWALGGPRAAHARQPARLPRTTPARDGNPGGRLVSTLDTKDGDIFSATISRDGTRAAACGQRYLKVWDALTGGELLDLMQFEATVSAVAFSADGA